MLERKISILAITFLFIFVLAGCSNSSEKNDVIKADESQDYSSSVSNENSQTVDDLENSENEKNTEQSQDSKILKVAREYLEKNYISGVNDAEIVSLEIEIKKDSIALICCESAQSSNDLEPLWVVVKLEGDSWKVQEIVHGGEMSFLPCEYPDLYSQEEIEMRCKSLEQESTDNISEDNRQRSMEFVSQGTSHLKKKEYAKAMNSFVKALYIYPQNASALYKKGFTHEMLGQRQTALNLYEMVVDLPSNDVFTLNNKGAAYYGLGEREKSLEAYDQAIAIDSNNAIGYYDKGAIYSIENNPEKSLENLKRAIEIDERQKAKAKTDRDYDNVRHLSEFRDIIAGK